MKTQCLPGMEDTRAAKEAQGSGLQLQAAPYWLARGNRARPSGVGRKLYPACRGMETVHVCMYRERGGTYIWACTCVFSPRERK